MLLTGACTLLGAGVVVYLCLHRRVGEAYYCWRWTRATEQTERDEYFRLLCDTNPAEERMREYFRQRALELVVAERLAEILRLIDMGYGKELVCGLDAALRNSVPNADVFLCMVGEPAVCALVGALGDKDASVRAAAAWALGAMGEEAGRAVPALIEALKDDAGTVREKAAIALGDIGREARQAQQALEEVFASDPDPTVRFAAYYGLCHIGPAVAGQPAARPEKGEQTTAREDSEGAKSAQEGTPPSKDGAENEE